MVDRDGRDGIAVFGQARRRMLGVISATVTARG
jgi:hypothetical protein